MARSQPSGHEIINGRCDRCGKYKERLEGESMPDCAALNIGRGVADAADFSPKPKVNDDSK